LFTAKKRAGFGRAVKEKKKRGESFLLGVESSIAGVKKEGGGG